MSFSFSSIGHFFASVANDIVKVAKVVGPIYTKIDSAEPTVELLSSLVFPSAVPLERGAFALLGMAAQVVQEAGDAAGAGGLNITLDQQLVQDIKTLIPAIEAYAKQFGITKPVTPVKTQS